LYNLLYSGGYDCIFITESWLYPEIPNGLLDPEKQFYIFRTDRKVHRGGGVCVFVANHLDCSEIALNETDSFAGEEVELSVFDIVCRPRKYRFMLVYRRPENGAAAAAAADKLCNIMGQQMNRNGPNILLGDFNCPNIDWTYGHAPSQCAEIPIYNFCNNNGFSQCVADATRGTNTLDIVCCDEPILMSSICVQPPFSSSDHDCVDFELVLPSSELSGDISRPSTETYKHYKWTETDYDAMSEYLYGIDWSQMFAVNLTPDTLWSAFCERLDEAIELFVPTVEIRTRKSAKIRHYPRHIRRLISKKLTVWRAYKANRNDPSLKARYNMLADECRNAIKQHEIFLENRVIDSNNIGTLYNHVNKKLSNRTKIGVLKTSDGNSVSTDAEKAEILNEYFCSVCTQDNGQNPPFESQIADGEAGITTISFEDTKLIAAVRRIKTKVVTSSGPDGYPVILLKNTIGSLVQPLSQMFASFMSVGKMPNSWKVANVTPLYKKGPSSDPANYRPVSQTSIFCKLMERVIVADVTYYMKQKGLISKHQHGFLNGRSTTTNLLESLSDWTASIDNKITQTVIYVDFTRAFDTVSRPKLLTKLKSYGVNGDLLSFISDFLTDRSQRTRVGNKLSNTATLSSGVVQGSCLGPLLFLLFINDLPSIFDSTITPKMYADDLKIYAKIESNIDSEHLQQNIDRLVYWAQTWQLAISIRKCQTMKISRQRHATMHNTVFKIDSHSLPNMENVSDLGVIVDHELTFSAHINRLVHKAVTRSKLIKKCFASRDINNLVKAFLVYVLPIVEYCSQIWSPHLIKDIAAVESVQRKFTKWLPGMRNKSYSERLQITGLERLDVRRLRLDLILTYKILFGLTCLESSDFFTYSPLQTTRGHDYKLFMPNCKTDCRKYFFSNRILDAWNNLPADTTDFSTLTKFRSCLFKTDLTKYCIPLN